MRITNRRFSHLPNGSLVLSIARMVMTRKEIAALIGVADNRAFYWENGHNRIPATHAAQFADLAEEACNRIAKISPRMARAAMVDMEPLHPVLALDSVLTGRKTREERARDERKKYRDTHYKYGSKWYPFGTGPNPMIAKSSGVATKRRNHLSSQSLT